MLDPEIPEPQPASDMVWMLLSNQVDRVLLIRKLVEEFYPLLYQQAVEKLNEPVSAQRVVEHTLAALISNAHRFSADQDLDEWMRSLFTREIQRSRRWQKLRRLFKRGPKDEPSDLSMDALHQLEPDSIAVLITRVEKSINDQNRRLQVNAGLQWAIIFGMALLLLLRLGWNEEWSLPAPAPSPPSVSTRLITHLVRITPTPPSTSTPSNTAPPTLLPPSAVLYIVKPGDTLFSISNKTGVDPIILMAINGLQDEQALIPGERLIVAVGQIPQVMITPTAVTPAPTREPLTAQSSVDEITQFVITNARNWNTIWLDAQIIDYGPPGYVGSPLVWREQLWLIATLEGLYINGREGAAQPERITLSLNGTEYSYSLGNHRLSIVNGAGSILGYTRIQQLVYPDFIEMVRDQLEIAGTEKVAGRDAIVVDHYMIEDDGAYFQGRYSIDAHTGIGLRFLTYLDDQRQVLSQEILITDIRYDQDFPAEVFDPYARAITQFADGPEGTPQDSSSLSTRLDEVYAFRTEPLPHRTPPPDFDPSASQLTFQYPSLTRLGGALDLAEVFAGGYYLGKLEFGDPWNINCTRSPNGRFIAFFPYLEEEPYRGSLHWFDVLDLSVIHNPIPELQPDWDNMAFSPDSRRLAFSACLESERECNLYLLDLISNEIEPLHEGIASSLVWSPDGRQLAFLGARTRGQDYQVNVLDTITGEVTYSGRMDWENNTPADPDAPILSWGIDFPIWNTGLEACTAPPR